MTHQPGTRLLVTRIHTGRVIRWTGTVVEDYGYGLLWCDDQDGHRKHLCTDPEALAEYGATQTITPLPAA